MTEDARAKAKASWTGAVLVFAATNSRSGVGVMIEPMVRPERRVVLAGESPAWVSAEAPSSRSQSGGEILPAERDVKSPCKRGEQTSGPQHKVNAAASSDYQPKGVWEGRAAHSTAKATDSIRDSEGMLDFLGVEGDGTMGQSHAEQERPYLAAESGQRPGV